MIRNCFKPTPVMNRPNYKIWWKEGKGYRKPFDIEVYDKTKRCHMCGKLGAFYLQSDYEKIGLCFKHMKATGDWERLEQIK